jgi:type II secretory ATPase GspE/PulE/Tfp pilus assembly ATPase PilB-like protein
MGIEPYLLASTINGILAQRLVRRTCESCRKATPVPEKHRHLFGKDQPDVIYHGAGCTECRGLGYKGRVGVFELLTLNSDLRRLINARATEEAILEAARANGLSTLREQALELVRQGVTTIDEITRVFHEL